VSTFNARSICNKLPELHRLLYHETRHVVLITETWLNKNICDGFLDPDRKYCIFRCDRNDRRGGGVCILVNCELKAIRVPVLDSYSDIELVCVDIWCNAKCRLVGVYRSTDCKQQSEPYVRQLVQCLESLTRVTWYCRQPKPSKFR